MLRLCLPRAMWTTGGFIAMSMYIVFTCLPTLSRASAARRPFLVRERIHRHEHHAFWRRPAMLHVVEPKTLLLRGGQISTQAHQNITIDRPSNNSEDFLNGTTNKAALVAGDKRRGPTPTAPTPAWKQSFPTALSTYKSLHRLQLQNIDLYLLGTAHVSNDSSVHVRLLLDHVDPDAIMVELCEARIPLLLPPETTENETAASITPSSKGSLMRKARDLQQTQGGSRMQAIGTVLLSSVQEDYADSLGVELGGEFRVAHDYWYNRTASGSKLITPAMTSDYRPCHLILGDRPVQLTLVRAWESLSWWPKFKVMVGLLWSSIRKPKPEEIRKWLADVMSREDSDVLTKSLEEMRQSFPTLYETIIKERDAYLAAKLIQSCQALQLQQQQQQQPQISSSTESDRDCRIKLVAIVGAGHVPGIIQWLVNSTATTPEEILLPLVKTRRWSHDEIVQSEYIPVWVNEVTLMQPTTPPPPPP